MDYIITITRPEGVTLVDKDNNYLPGVHPEKLDVFTIVNNVRPSNEPRRPGYYFDMDGKTYWTYYAWLFAENTEKNMELLKLVDDKRKQVAELESQITTLLKDVVRIH